MLEKDYIADHLRTFMRDLTSLGGGFLVAVLTAFLYVLGEITIVLRIAAAFLIAYVGASAIRAVRHRDRPEKEDYRNFIERIDASSFPSIHTANSFYVAYILHYSFSSIPLSIFLFSLASLIGYTRVYLRKHYWSDVIGGAGVGLIAGYAAVVLI